MNGAKNAPAAILASKEVGWVGQHRPGIVCPLRRVDQRKIGLQAENVAWGIGIAVFAASGPI